MEYKINIEKLHENIYKEIEIDVYQKRVDHQDKNGFDYVKTIILNDDALLVGNVNNYKWELNLDDEYDRKLFRNTIFLKFMTAVYENSEEKPYPLQGDLLYRVPLINRIFARPYDREKKR